MAHGQELHVWLLTTAHQSPLALLLGLPVHGWDLRLAGEGLEPEPRCPYLVPLSGRCMESCTRRRREEATSDRGSPAHSLMHFTSVTKEVGGDFLSEVKGSQSFCEQPGAAELSF